MNIEKDEVIIEYVLVDYLSSWPPDRYKPVTVVKMTKWEASERNKGFALNGVTMRYIKGV